VEHKGLPIVAFASVADWSAWLTENGVTSTGVWLKFAKKGSGVASVGKAEAIEAAIAHGWIDGQINPLDERAWLVRFTARGSKSRWSQISRATAERLIDAGRMQPAGLAAVEAARADGRWAAAYPSQSGASMPDDLQAALDAAAKSFFANLDSANRYAVLYRVHHAKSGAARAAMIAKMAAMLARGEAIHPIRGKD
jgi:uncharacterized protein YdeI (YjbR/CyaY-like superfamily)